MRATLLILTLLGSVANANTRVVVMTNPDDAAAMQVALAGRGADIAVVPAPEGALRLDRAAVAQREAMSAQAIAGVWIEQEPGETEVCVVSSDGHVFRHAPLPIEDASPRVFAAIATSLLDEVLAPPAEPNINVDVNVSVGGASTPSAAAAPLNYGGPGMLPVIATASAEPVRANRTLLEVGPMLTPVSTGIELGLAFPVAPRWRVAVGGIANVTFIYQPRPLLGALGEVRHVGLGRRHFDIGVGGGVAATDTTQPVAVATVRLGMTWEGPGHGVNISIVPALVMPLNDPTTQVVPGIFGSVRWELAL
jgi:hypothetical protein